MTPLHQPTISRYHPTRWLFLSKLSLSGLVFWISVYLIERFDWDQGKQRALITVLLLVATPLLIGLTTSNSAIASSAPESKPQPPPESKPQPELQSESESKSQSKSESKLQPESESKSQSKLQSKSQSKLQPESYRKWLLLGLPCLLIPIGMFIQGVTVWGRQDGPQGLLNSGHYVLLYALLVLASLVGIVLPLGLWAWHVSSRLLTQRRLSLTLFGLVVSLLLVHLAIFLYFFPNPALIDVGTTTLAAAQALLRGENPYLLPIDVNPARPASDLRYQGYKYLPMMAITYLPLSGLGQQGILLTNLLLDLLTVGLIGRLAMRLGRKYAIALLAALLYLMLPLIPRELFQQGVTDLVTIAPLLAAFLALKRRPGLAGFFVGLSVSMKLLPGALFVPCCLPAYRRWSYLTGVMIGLVPVLVFLVISPAALIDNIVLFNADRAIDSTSWLYGMPDLLNPIARLACLTLLVSISAYVWLKSPPLLYRCGLGVISILAVILCGPINHRNYQLWWIPLFVVILAMAVGPLRTNQTNDRSPPPPTNQSGKTSVVQHSARNPQIHLKSRHILHFLPEFGIR